MSHLRTARARGDPRERLARQASYSEDGWVRNLRAAGQATMTDHGRPIVVQTVELLPEEAAAIIRHALEMSESRGRGGVRVPQRV